MVKGFERGYWSDDGDEREVVAMGTQYLKRTKLNYPGNIEYKALKLDTRQHTMKTVEKWQNCFDKGLYRAVLCSNAAPSIQKQVAQI